MGKHLKNAIRIFIIVKYITPNINISLSYISGKYISYSFISLHVTSCRPLTDLLLLDQVLKKASEWIGELRLTRNNCSLWATGYLINTERFYWIHLLYCGIKLLLLYNSQRKNLNCMSWKSHTFHMCHRDTTNKWHSRGKDLLWPRVNLDSFTPALALC